MNQILNNPKTGEPYTAKWATIFSGIGGVLVLLSAMFAKFLGIQLTWGEAVPVAMLLFGIGTVGLNAMRNKRNGG